jgi:hypothetical protein
MFIYPISKFIEKVRKLLENGKSFKKKVSHLEDSIERKRELS